MGTVGRRASARETAIVLCLRRGGEVALFFRVPGMTRPVPDALAVAGVDFTSRPTRRKPITVALGRLQHGVVRLDRRDAHTSFEGFARWLDTPGPWTVA